MTYRVTVEIVCDHKGCMNIVSRNRINQGGLSKTWAGHLAAAVDGWWTGPNSEKGPSDPKVAYCPTHRAEHGK